MSTAASGAAHLRLRAASYWPSPFPHVLTNGVRVGELGAMCNPQRARQYARAERQTRFWQQGRVCMNNAHIFRRDKQANAAT